MGCISLSFQFESEIVTTFFKKYIFSCFVIMYIFHSVDVNQCWFFSVISVNKLVTYYKLNFMLFILLRFNRAKFTLILFSFDFQCVGDVKISWMSNVKLVQFVYAIQYVLAQRSDLDSYIIPFKTRCWFWVKKKYIFFLLLTNL